MEENNKSIVIKSLANNLVYILIGCLAYVFFTFTFRGIFPISSLLQHVILCCLGVSFKKFIFLMYVIISYDKIKYQLK